MQRHSYVPFLFFCFQLKITKSSTLWSKSWRADVYAQLSSLRALGSNFSALLSPLPQLSYNHQALVCARIYMCDLSTRLPVMLLFGFLRRVSLWRQPGVPIRTKKLAQLIPSQLPLSPSVQQDSSDPLRSSPPRAQRARDQFSKQTPTAAMYCARARCKHFTTSRGQRSVPEERDGDALTPHWHGMIDDYNLILA